MYRRHASCIGDMSALVPSKSGLVLHCNKQSLRYLTRGAVTVLHSNNILTMSRYSIPYVCQVTEEEEEGGGVGTSFSPGYMF